MSPFGRNRLERKVRRRKTKPTQTKTKQTKRSKKNHLKLNPSPPPVCWMRAAFLRVENMPSSESFPMSSSMARTKHAASCPSGVPAPARVSCQCEKTKKKKTKQKTKQKKNEKKRGQPVNVGELGKNNRHESAS